MHLHGKAVVVTGAGRGVGAAYARGAAALGASVVVNDIDDALAQEVASGIRDAGGAAVARGADIANAGDAAALIDFCVASFGGIDGLVNNAGLLRLGRLESASESDFRAMFDANVIGTFNCAQHAIRRMYAQKRGSIVNVVSGAQTGLPALGGYSATKGAVASFTYTWAMEAQGSGVRINAVSPFADTRMTSATNDYYAAQGKKVRTPSIAPEANVPVVTYLLSDLSSHVNGQVVRITGTKLSLMTHPAILSPVLDNDAWTIESVSAAFRDTLGARQVPCGLSVYDVTHTTKPA
jgi:NAD(P)-dependent dehydrogenase (short-subunit alcohol dehydrogenase family)